MYYLVKYNNGMSHRLDTYNTLTLAIGAAKDLHHPDWPVWQGILVKDIETNCKYFDTQRGKMAYYVFHKDLKKKRRAVDLSKIDTFCKKTIRKDRLAEKIRKEKRT